MSLGAVILGTSSGVGAEVAGTNQLKVIPEVDAINHPGNVGDVAFFSEVDQGYISASRSVMSPEADFDFRLRMSLDLLLDDEMFNYTAQNTGKHSYLTTTMTNSWTAGQMTTNSGSIVTTTTGTVFQSYALFPINGTQTLSVDAQVTFSAQPTANTFVEFGPAIPGAQTVAPTDGIFFRLNSAGLQGIASFNGGEVSTGVFKLAAGAGTWVYTNNKHYEFICYASANAAMFWVNDGGVNGPVLLGLIELPTGTGSLCMAASVPFMFKQRITGGAGGAALQATLTRYSVRQGGAVLASSSSEQGNRLYGSYQGLSGGTMGSLATYANSTNPTAAAPSNTALTANLPGGIGGQGNVTAAVAAATDGIWNSYQVPAGTVNIPGKRLVIKGVRLDAVNTGAAVATTATTIQFSLAFGHTAVSLATSEGAAAKAPRRIPLGIMTWAVAAAVGQGPQSGPIQITFANPIFVNPAEFIQLVGKFLVGTATASQTINFTMTYDYGWE